MPKPRFDLFIRRPAAVRSIDDAALLGLPLLGSISEIRPETRRSFAGRFGRRQDAAGSEPRAVWFRPQPRAGCDIDGERAHDFGGGGSRRDAVRGRTATRCRSRYLLADLEGALRLIRDIRLVGRDDGEIEHGEEDSEFMTMDRTDR
jgi:hypothetical protein